MTLKLQQRPPKERPPSAQVAPAKKAAALKAANDAKKARPPWLQQQASPTPSNEPLLISNPVRVAHRSQGPPRWIPDPIVAKRYQVNPRTLRRWDQDPSLDFPPVIIVNSRRYRELAALEEWERAMAAHARSRARRHFSSQSEGSP